MSGEMGGACVRNVLEWLEATAARVPDKVAVSGVDDELSFGALQERARALGTCHDCGFSARLLPEDGVPEQCAYFSAEGLTEWYF